MTANLSDHGTRLSMAPFKAKLLHFIILCIAAIVFILLAFMNPANAAEQNEGRYLSPAHVPVTMEPLAAVSREEPELLASSPPSRILLIGKSKKAQHRSLPPQNVVGKMVKNSAGDEIGIVTKVDGALVVVAVGGYSGTGTYDVGLNWDYFATSGKSTDIRLLTNVSTITLRKLPAYRRLD